MKIHTFLFLVFILGSCAVNSVSSQGVEKNETEVAVEVPQHNVQIMIREHIPYCGGAYPSDEQLNRSKPYDAGLVLTNTIDGSKKDVNAKNGVLYLNLPEGKYTLKEKYKDIPFNQFFLNAERSGGSYIIPGDSICYKKWWESNLVEFEVISNEATKILNCTVSSRCYTGINPCDYYNGPYPP